MWLIIIYETDCMLPIFVADSTCLSQRRHNLHTPGLDINHKSSSNLHYAPMRYWAGTSQDFLLPNLAQNTESTMGAQSTFMEKG